MSKLRKIVAYLKHCSVERKIRCLGRDLNLHPRVFRPPLYPLSYRVMQGLAASLTQFKRRLNAVLGRGHCFRKNKTYTVKVKFDKAPSYNATAI